MILYLDASALVKRYVLEPGSAEVMEAIDQAEMIATSIITRAEVAAALGKAARMQILEQQEARAALVTFRSEWPDLIRLQITEMVVAYADRLSWEYGLRGYDAVHLASALLWQDAMGERITMATFDKQLWRAAEQAGLLPWPTSLSTFLREKGEQG